MAETLERAGQVIIDKIYLYSADKTKKLDISLLFSEVDIYEDIYSPMLHGSVLMVDGFNLISEFPILGEEIIEFICHTPTFTTGFSKLFSVVGVDDKMIDTNKKVVYAIKFVSMNAIIDMTAKVYKAYSGTPSDSASSIFQEFFLKDTLVVEKSANSLKFVAPTVSPFKAINMLASKAMTTTSYGAPNFLFYEDNQTYKFMSLSSLFKQNPVINLRYSYSQLRTRDSTGESTRDVNAEYENVLNMEISRLFNTLDKNIAGALGQKTIEVDIIRKQSTKRTFSYFDDFAKSQHLNKNPVHSKHLITTYDNVVETCITDPYVHTSYPQDRDGIVQSKRMPLLSQNEFIKLDIIIHGRTDIKVGDVVNFDMGEFSTSDETEKYIKTGVDSYYSGNYLISAMCHRFTKTRHEISAQIVKDSFNSPITFDNMR